jgi:hypothetical protein
MLLMSGLSSGDIEGDYISAPTESNREGRRIGFDKGDAMGYLRASMFATEEAP